MRRSGLGATLGLEVKQGQHEGHGQGEGMLGAGYRAGVPGPAGPGRRFHRFQSNTNAEYLQMEERKTFQCAVMSLSLAFCLIVAGSVMINMADYGGYKTSLVEDYNRAVDVWSSTYAAPFNSTSFAVEYGGEVVGLAVSAAAEAVDEAGGAVHHYLPAVFHLDSLLEAAAIPGMIASGDLPHMPSSVEQVRAGESDGGAGGSGGGGGGGAGDLDGAGAAEGGDAAGAEGGDAAEGGYNGTAAMEWLMTPREVVLVAMRAGGGVDRISLGAHALVSRRVLRSSGWKVCKYQMAGSYRAGSCTTFNTLDALCVKVSQGAGGAWAPDASFGGVGCSPRQDWDPVKVRRIHAPAGGRLPRLSTVRRLGAGSVAVRSAHDPHIAALNVTGGTMFFAERAAEASATGVVLLIIGTVLLLPGVALAAPYVRRAARGVTIFSVSARRERSSPAAFDDIL